MRSATSSLPPSPGAPSATGAFRPAAPSARGRSIDPHRCMTPRNQVRVQARHQQQQRPANAIRRSLDADVFGSLEFAGAPSRTVPEPHRGRPIDLFEGSAGRSRPPIGLTDRTCERGCVQYGNY